MDKAIAANSTATNPYFEQIELCDALIKLCSKNEEPEESKQTETVQTAQTSSLETAVKQGKVLAAPSKQEKEGVGMFGELQAWKKKSRARK